MRRAVGVAVLGGLLAAMLAGCGNPAGVDGDLVDDWKAQSEATSFVPESGVCHLSLPDEERLISRTQYNPLDCGTEHHYETVYVGELTGTAKDASGPPEAGSEGARKAFQECNTKVNEYVGADWRGGRLDLYVYYPAKTAWEGGSRWFRCDVAEIESLDSTEIKRRSGNLKDVLKAAAPIAFGCFRAVLAGGGQEISAMNAVACGQAHGAEYAGVWTAPETSYADFEKNTQRAHDGCRGVVAKWAKVPNDGNIKFRTGTIIYFPTEDEWNNGDRGVQCFLWISDQNLRRSMKGAGPGALRIR
jgi:Septum formation